MGFISDLNYSLKKTLKVYGFYSHDNNYSTYDLYNNAELLFTFRVVGNNLKSVERYINHVHKCTIDNIQFLDNNNLILFSVMNEELKAHTLILKRI